MAERGDGMSVLIRGMEMPERCAMCFLRVGDCKQRIYMEQRPKACPLIEIPTPHSDLVDRDAMIAEYDRQHKGPAGGARKIMVDAKAVIEAEGSKDE